MSDVTPKARPVHALKARGSKWSRMVLVCGRVGWSARCVGFDPTADAVTCPQCKARLSAGADYIKGPADLRQLA